MSAICRSLAALVLTSLSACATGHSAMNGSVIMKISETEAHVCLFEQQAPVGTKVQLYRHTCTSPAAGETAASGKPAYKCDKQLVAVGTVANAIGEHYAQVTFPQGTQIEEGYTVEPVR